MNGIRIRPFEAAAILAALTLLTGCSLLKFSVDTGGEPLSKEETRMRLLTRGFYYEASDEVTAAADSIAAGSDDAELQRRTIRWKLRTTRAAVDAAMQQAPELALLDTWIRSSPHGPTRCFSVQVRRWRGAPHRASTARPDTWPPTC